MRWDRNYNSSDIEDRRSEGPTGGGGGGMGMFGLVSLLSRFGWPGIIIALLIGGVVAYRNMSGGGGKQLASPQDQDEVVHFVGYVFDDAQNMWSHQIDGYQKAKLVLFRGSTRSGCGVAQEQIGPFYCPRDEKVYIDLSFYDDLRKKFGAPGDFAEAYVIAHELGHHVQRLAGLLGDNEGSVEIELQADCFAGAWARDADQRGLLEVGDLDEALNAAKQIGDDTLQKKAQGYVQPEKFTHGSAAQRSAALRKGFEGGPRACLSR